LQNSGQKLDTPKRYMPLSLVGVMNAKCHSKSWQFQHGHLISRLNSDLLSFLSKNEEINEEFVETIVDSWELLIHGLEGLQADMESNSGVDG